MQVALDHQAQLGASVLCLHCCNELASYEYFPALSFSVLPINYGTSTALHSPLGCRLCRTYKQGWPGLMPVVWVAQSCQHSVDRQPLHLQSSGRECPGCCGACGMGFPRAQLQIVAVAVPVKQRHAELSAVLASAPGHPKSSKGCSAATMSICICRNMPKTSGCSSKQTCPDYYAFISESRRVRTTTSCD